MTETPNEQSPAGADNDTSEVSPAPAEPAVVDTSRFSRQEDIVPLEKLQALTITIIGVGAVGRHIARHLACMGASHLILIDHDAIETTNITTQEWPKKSVGLLKVGQLKDEIASLSPECLVQAVPERYSKRYLPGKGAGPANRQVYFFAVDKISVREQIWNDIKENVEFMADGRMLAETMRILTATHREESRERYTDSLFAEEEAQVGRCTAQSTVYTGSICAGIMLHQFTRWLRHEDLDEDLLINLPQSLMCVQEAGDGGFADSPAEDAGAAETEAAEV